MAASLKHTRPAPGKIPGRGIAIIEVPSFAKLNLDLRVLYKRPDGYHELRTIFQTISLHDTLAIEFEQTKRTKLTLSSSIEIEDNIILKAAKAVLEELRISAWVRLFLKKVIPMGAGLGGGSSNAAAVLLALPALAGKRLPIGRLHSIASDLGSDVPFFLYGGTALGLGRGTELYPLPDQGPAYATVVSNGIHVSTAAAYQALCRPTADSDHGSLTNALTSQVSSPILREFQAVVWGLDRVPVDQLALRNDFEDVVFRAHPQLAAIKKKLKRLGANPARMTGSGSAVYGLVSSPVKARRVALEFPDGKAYPVRFLTRRQYRSHWLRALGDSAPGSVFADVI